MKKKALVAMAMAAAMVAMPVVAGAVTSLVVSLMELLVRIHQAKARIILILAASRESRTPILMLDPMQDQE